MLTCFASATTSKSTFYTRGRTATMCHPGVTCRDSLCCPRSIHSDECYHETVRSRCECVTSQEKKRCHSTCQLAPFKCQDHTFYLVTVSTRMRRSKSASGDIVMYVPHRHKHARSVPAYPSSPALWVRRGPEKAPYVNIENWTLELLPCYPFFCSLSISPQNRGGQNNKHATG